MEPKISIRPLESVLPHEETIPEHTKWVVEAVKRDGVQKDPIIIDAESSAVLDGMHRLAAFKELRTENVVCAGVDYSSPLVGLHRWARVYSAPPALATEALGSRHLDRIVGVAEAFEVLRKGTASIAAMTGGKCFLAPEGSSLEDGFEVIRSLDAVAQRNRWKRDFIPEDEVDLPIGRGDNLVLLTKRLGKKDVLSAAISGRLFPCKTTLHAIEPRPVALNFPLSRLPKADSRQIREMFSPNPKVLPPNSTYDGRRYKESLLLLRDQ